MSAYFVPFQKSLSICYVFMVFSRLSIIRLLLIFICSLASPTKVRRHFLPQVNFSFDGYFPFKSLPHNQASAMFKWGLSCSIASHSHQNLIIICDPNGTQWTGIYVKAWNILSNIKVIIIFVLTKRRPQMQFW